MPESTGGRTYRDRILKVLTNRPGDVVYREDIQEVLPDLTGEQIANAIQRLKTDTRTPIGKDIDVVVQARAWRYVPNARVRQAVKLVKKPTPPLSNEGKRERGTPLTTSIRSYFIANPNRPIFLDELREMMSIDDDPLDLEKVRVGVANARQHSRVFRNCLVVVVAGQAWQYVPPADESVAEEAPPTTIIDLLEHSQSQSTAVAPVAQSTPVKPSAPATTAAAPTPTPTTSQDELLLLEKVGTLDDGSVVVRDTTDKTLYRMSRM